MPAGDRSPRTTPAGTAGVSVSAGRSRSPSARDLRLAETGILLTAVIWSLNFVVVKASIAEIGPLTFNAVRYGIATITLFTLLRLRSGTIRVPKETVLPLLALGAFGFGCYQVAWILGLMQVSAGDSSLIVATSPVLTAIIAGVIGIDRLTPPKLAGALVAFAGVAIVIGGEGHLTLGSSLAGDGLTLLAALIWSLYPVLGMRMLARVDPMQTTAWTVLGGTLLVIPLGIAEVLFGGGGGTWMPLTVVGVLFSGSMAAGIANVLIWNAIRHIGPTRATVTQFLVPPGAVLLGALFLNEPVGLPQILGGAVIVLGLWLTRQASMIPGMRRGRSLGS